MQVKINCHHNDGEIGRIFTVQDYEMEKMQVCYFDRFIPQLEKICADLLHKFRFSTIEYLSLVVSCHGYNHHYNFKNGKIVIAK